MRSSSTRRTGLVTMISLLGAATLLSGCGDNGQYLPAGAMNSTGIGGAGSALVDDPVLGGLDAGLDGMDSLDDGLGAGDPLAAAANDWNNAEGSLSSVGLMDNPDDGLMDAGWNDPGYGAGYGNGYGNGYGSRYGGYGNGIGNGIGYGNGLGYGAAGYGNGGLMNAGIMDGGLIDDGLMNTGLIDDGMIDAGNEDLGIVDPGFDAGYGAGYAPAPAPMSGGYDSGFSGAAPVSGGFDVGMPSAGAGDFGGTGAIAGFDDSIAVF